MRLSDVLAVVLLLAPTACRVVPSLPQPYIATNITTLIKVFGTPLAASNYPASGGDSPPPGKRPLSPTEPDTPPAKRPKVSPSEPDPPAAAPQTEWDNHVCRGEKLTLASKLGKEEADSFMLPINTNWKGTLELERKLWGYTLADDPECDFEGDYYDISRAYDELNVLHGDYECFRIFHYDPDKVDENGRDIQIRDQRYVVEGKVYRATGAHATFGINVDEGVVWFIDRASAPLKAAQLWGVNKAPLDELPLLRQMSDLSWGFWYQAHSGSNLGHITKFIIPQVINAITNRLLTQALETYIVSDGQERHTTVPVWPGITFDVETEQGKALLGSPNGIAVAYFLSQHKDELTVSKYVYKITVFQPDEDAEGEDPTIVFYVKDAPAISPDDENTEEQEQSQGLTSRDLVLNADTDLWHDCICRGEKLTLISRSSKDKAAQFAEPIDSPWDGTMETELKLWGYEEHPADSHCNFDDIEPALVALKIGRLSANEGGPNQCYQVRHWYDDARGPNGEHILREDQTYTVNGQKFRMTGAYSIIGANARSGVVFFVDVKSAHHAAEELWAPEIPTAKTLPALRSISDISWAFWNRAQNQVPARERSTVNFFVVHNIVNADTEQLIEHSLKVYDVPEGQQRVDELPTWPGVIFNVESEAGQAMLGSPNGLAAGYFLAQHKTQIGGNKYVYQVQLFASEWGGGPAMILHVKDAPTPPPDDSKPHQEQGQNHHLTGRDLHPAVEKSPTAVTLAGNDDAAFWWKYVCRGEKLTQASVRNKDTATNFAEPIDSEWDGTLEAELKLWGYIDHKGRSMYCELDNIADSLNQIGVNAKFKSKDKNGQNECFHIQHRIQSNTVPVKDQTYQVDGKTYRITNAYAHIGVNSRDGVVSFLNVKSAERAAAQNWKVGKPAEADLPKLKQISDIAWGFWRRAHKDGAGLENINKFIVHDIINEDTLKLVELALMSYKVPAGQQREDTLPRWPGLVFDIETEEGKAMLGSPNGIAAGYFLAQHKSQLGSNKYVSQVSIWMSRDGLEQMMFWVKNAPPPPAEEEEQNKSELPTPERDGDSDAYGETGKIVKRSVDGRSIVREHMVLAKL